MATRRADWRWLLPEHRRSRALCLADGDLAIAAHAAATSVDTLASRGANGSYDLAIAERCDVTTLQVARAALADGGVLYAEQANARGINIRQLRRRFVEAGFADVSLVAPWPSLGAAELWLPVRPMAAARYVAFDHPLLARHPARRLWLRAQRLALLGEIIAGRPASLVVIARAGTSRSTAPWWATTPDAADTWLLLTPGTDVERRALGMQLSAGERRPSVVVKLARTPASTERMQRGFAALEQLRDAGVVAQGSVPAPIQHVRDVSGYTIAVHETAIHGRALDAVLRPSLVARYTEETTDWLIALANATRGAPRVDAWERAFQRVVTLFTEHCGHLVDRALLDQATARLRAIGPLPTVFEHRDFRPWNLYVTPDQHLVAFDWDESRRDGLPVLDLLHCHAYLSFAVDGTMRSQRFVEAYARAESSPLGTTRRACLTRYAAAVGIEDDAVRALRSFAWMTFAIMHARSCPHAARPLTLAALWEYATRRALESCLPLRTRGQRR